jgi:hypothetical protein
MDAKVRLVEDLQLLGLTDEEITAALQGDGIDPVVMQILKEG